MENEVFRVVPRFFQPVFML